MSLFVLDQDLSQSDTNAIRRQVATDVVDIVTTASPGTTDLIYRQTVATDWLNGSNTLVGPLAATPTATLTNQTALVANTYSANQFNGLTIDDKVAIIVYGWEIPVDVDQHIVEIVFKVGTATLCIISLHSLRSVSSGALKRGYFIDPISFKPKDEPSLLLLSDLGVPLNVEAFTPLAMTAEPESRNQDVLPNLLARGVPGHVG